MSVPKEHVHMTFLTSWIGFVGILGFQIITLCCKTPCSWLMSELFMVSYGARNGKSKEKL